MQTVSAIDRAQEELLKAQRAEVAEVDRELLELKQERLRLLNLKEDAYRDRALEMFIPHTKQFEFFFHGDKKGRGGFCGNRFGKSTIGVVEDISWALGERPFFPVGHELRTKGIPEYGIKGLILSEDWDKVHDIFTNSESKDRPGKFFEYLPKSKIHSTTKMQKGVINSITTRNVLHGVERESSLMFDTVKSFLNNPRSFESSDWDFIHVDEPIMEELWLAVSRGLIDRGGKYWWLLTALGFPWMYDTMTDQVKRDPERFFMFEASMDDNPLLSEQDKQDYLSQLSPDELSCRRDGKPLSHGRRVYGHFNEATHVWPHDYLPSPEWKDARTPPLSYSSLYALDPHPQTPHAVLFAATSPDGTIYIFDEIFEKLLISEVAQKIQLRRFKLRLEGELCDPCAWIENPDTGHAWVHTLYEYGLNVIRASKDKTDGIIEAQEVWKKKRIFVMPHCVNFIREIKKYFFDKENKPIDKDDHMMENFYRLNSFNGFRYVLPPNPKPQRFKIKDEFADVPYDLPHMDHITL